MDIILARNAGRVMVLVLCILMMLSNCTKFHENISKDYGVLERTSLPHPKKIFFSKAHNFVKNVDVVTIFCLCTSKRLIMHYTCTVFRENISKGF